MMTLEVQSKNHSILRFFFTRLRIFEEFNSIKSGWAGHTGLALNLNLPVFAFGWLFGHPNTFHMEPFASWTLEKRLEM